MEDYFIDFTYKTVGTTEFKIIFDVTNPKNFIVMRQGFIEIQVSRAMKTGNEYAFMEELKLRITDAFKVPFVSAADGQPIMIDNPDFDSNIDESETNPVSIPKTIGEFEYWINVFTPILVPPLVNGLQKRVLEVDEDAVFDPMPTPLQIEE